MQRPAQVTAPVDHSDVCLALLVVRDALLMDRVPPPFATPEQVQAAAEVNADLASLRENLFTLDGFEHLNCQGRR